jgi:hypothetical protein
MGRAKPFSSKKKKQQLQDKRAKKEESKQTNDKEISKLTIREDDELKVEEINEDDSVQQKKFSKKSSKEESNHDEASEDYLKEREITSISSGPKFKGNKNAKDSLSASWKIKDYDKKDLRTVFEKESKEEIDARKEAALLPLDLKNRNSVRIYSISSCSFNF